MSKIPYKRGTRAKGVIRTLLEHTGMSHRNDVTTRNGKSSDYNFCRNVAQFGNENGYITLKQLKILGCIYNRVMKELGTRKTSWRCIK